MTRVLALGLMSLSLTACVTSTQTRSTDLTIIRAGVEELTKPTRVAGPITERKDAVTNGDLWLLSGRQDDALKVANADKEAVNNFVTKALAAMAEERARACPWYSFSCKRKARGD